MVDSGAKVDESPKNESSTESERQNKITYNEKWCGYLGIMLSSLVNFASVADVSVDKISDIQLVQLNRENFEAIFGAVSFIVSLFILVFDRVSFLQKKFDFKTVSDGKLEGSVLLSLVIWWIVGVAIMTQAGGVAYTILNTYFSCWYTLGMSVWTLDKWTAAKDIISIHQLTRLSKTLPYWYILFFASIVATGSSIDLFARMNDVNTAGKKEYSISVGTFSVLFTTIAILAHYKLLCCSQIKPGGKLEITVGILLCIWWILAVSVLTTGQELASTIQGVTIQGVTMYPGSNLYLSLWLGLYGSVKICLEWKAAHAMKQLTKLTLQTIQNRGRIQTNGDNV